MKIGLIGFNALTRAYSISTYCKYGYTQSDEITVSMPLLGLIPFLQCIWTDHLTSILTVSMPLLGLIPFLQVDGKLKRVRYMSFNALTRAYSIST